MVFKTFKQRLPSLRRTRGDNAKVTAAVPPTPSTLPATPLPMATVTIHHSATTATHPSETTTLPSLPSNIAIAGGGIVGLMLALALTQQGVADNSRPERTIHVFEQAPAFHDDVGAGMGLYPNGLRVIRDISPALLQQLQQAGCPYEFRRWMRHDGTEVAVAEESVLARMSPTEEADPDLQPIGIRRWKLQHILFDACRKAGVVIHFGKRLESLKESSDSVVQMRFDDGTTHDTKLLLAADGSKSKVRSIVTGDACTLKYTGTTCLMGTSAVPSSDSGLLLPTSPTTKCHGAFYPTGTSEQCFQFHFPEKNAPSMALGGWGGMTHTMSQEECRELAVQLREQGWDNDRFLEPLLHVEKALRIGLTTLDPPLEKFTFDRIVLVGDAAHPPVPFLGQGAQQGLEDAGTLALLLRQFCVDNENEFTLERVQDALTIYNALRVPRTLDVTEKGKLAGKQQQKRAENDTYNRVQEERIQREVFYNETSSHLLPGVRHDYKLAVEIALTAYDETKAKDVLTADDKTKATEQKMQEEKAHRLLSVPEEE